MRLVRPGLIGAVLLVLPAWFRSTARWKTAFDLGFTTSMKTHHLGAIKMASSILSGGSVA